MVNKFGVHVGVGEGCAARGPAERETAIASITGKIATVRVCMKVFISRRDRISDAAASIKLPIPPGSACVPRADEAVSGSRTSCELHRCKSANRRIGTNVARVARSCLTCPRIIMLKKPRSTSQCVFQLDYFLKRRHFVRERCDTNIRN